MLVSALALLVLAFLVVLGPLIFKAAANYAPWIEPLESHYDFARVGIGGGVLAVALFILHMWLPAGRRGLSKVWPGIAATLALWLACGFAFGVTSTRITPVTVIPRRCASSAMGLTQSGFIEL